ncbi:MAG TPA: exo-alpha-sialidase, partial [Vicinamibacteria bacterium]
LYFIMEPTETDNVFLMVKSTDEGRTWREVDGGHRPQTDDLESVDARMVGDTIHILHQVTRSVRYHSFRTSDHPSRADTWAVRDELAATTESVAQAATLAVRSDGSLVAFYVGPAVQYSVRSTAGRWSPPRALEPRAKTAGPMAVLGADDAVHVAYYRTDGTLWHRRLRRDGTLTEAVPLAAGAGTTRAEYGSVLPLVSIPETNTVVVVYRLADGKLWERRIAGDGAATPPVRVTDRDVVRDAVDSQQPGADLVLDGTTLRVLFIETSSRGIFSTSDAGGWRPSTLEVGGILGSWVRGSVYTRRDGVKVYGYVYDAGSDGGSGMNRFGEVVLSAR